MAEPPREAHRRPHPHRWRRLRETLLLQADPWLRVYGDDVLLPDGRRVDGFLRVEGRPYSTVFAVTPGPDRRVLFLRQYKYGPDRVALQLPAGYLDPGEEPETAARRELLEETGYEGRELSHLVSVHTSPGRSTEVCHLFRCGAVRVFAGPAPEPTEFVSAVEVPLEEAKRKVYGGEITAATTVLGLLMTAG